MRTSRTIPPATDTHPGVPAEELLAATFFPPDVPSQQEWAVATIRRSSWCADLARRGCVDTNETLRDLGDALLAAQFDRAAALGLAHAWLAPLIPSGWHDGAPIADVECWRQRIAGRAGTTGDRRWLAWGVALAVAELNVRTLPWEPATGAFVEMLAAEGYDPTPWERREMRRCRLA